MLSMKRKNGVHTGWKLKSMVFVSLKRFMLLILLYDIFQEWEHFETYVREIYHYL